MYNKDRLDYFLNEGSQGHQFGKGVLTELEFKMAKACLINQGFVLVNYQVAPRTSNHSVYYFSKKKDGYDGYHYRVIC